MISPALFAPYVTSNTSSHAPFLYSPLFLIYASVQTPLALVHMCECYYTGVGANPSQPIGEYQCILC